LVVGFGIIREDDHCRGRYQQPAACMQKQPYSHLYPGGGTTNSHNTLELYRILARKTLHFNGHGPPEKNVRELKGKNDTSKWRSFL